jgi:hypothetical protein
MISKSLAFLAVAGLLFGAGLCLCAEEMPEISGVPAPAGHDHGALPEHSHSHPHDGEGTPGSHSHDSKDECGCSASVPDLLLDSELRGVRTDHVLFPAPALESASPLSTPPSATFDRPRDDSGPPRPSRLPLYLRIHKLSL